MGTYWLSIFQGKRYSTLDFKKLMTPSFTEQKPLND